VGLISRMLGIDAVVASNERLLMEVLRTSQTQNEALVSMTTLMTKMSETWVPNGVPELRDDEDYRRMMEEQERHGRTE
jgi:hypothetical protein